MIHNWTENEVASSYFFYLLLICEFSVIVAIIHQLMQKRIQIMWRSQVENEHYSYHFWTTFCTSNSCKSVVEHPTMLQVCL